MKRVFFLVLFAFSLFILAVFSYLQINARPFSTDSTSVRLVINKGDGLLDISKKLESNALIRNKYSFLFYAYKLGLNKKIQSGTFRLNPALSTSQIVVKLAQGGVSDYWLQIIEGTRVEEISHLFPPQTSFKNKEGYLYPDSYLIPTYFTADQIFSVIQNNFDKKFAQAKQDATNLNMSDTDVLILASIIEREARTLKSKREVAAVLLNRLGINMALQVDASVQYARDSVKKPITYWQPLDTSSLSIQSPFNTYKNPGLPPAPICNPGYDSIYAAFHPLSSDYLYYITGNDNLMHYAKTLSEHNSNISRYLK